MSASALGAAPVLLPLTDRFSSLRTSSPFAAELRGFAGLTGLATRGQCPPAFPALHAP
jgi:hypothetical protein